MQINVGQLLKDHIGATRSYKATDILGNEDVSLHIIDGSLDLLRTKRGILITASIDAEIEEYCIRCLKAITVPVSFRFEEEVFTESLKGIDDSDVDYEKFLIDNNNQLMLNELLRQYIELNKPVKPLCNPDCHGIQIS